MDYQLKRQSTTTEAVTTPHRQTILAPNNSSLQRAMTQFISTPQVAQQQAVSPVFQAASLQRQEEERIDSQRLRLQRQAEAIGADLPANAIPSALQRQATERTPAPAPSRPQTAGDWVTVMRAHAQSVEHKNELTGLNSHESAQLTALQRQTAHILAQSVKTSPLPSIQRHAEFAQHALSLQRHPLTSAIPRAALNLITPGERPLLQRAVDEAMRADSLQRQQDAQALQLHSLQRQMAELDAQATRPVLQRIEERRGSGNPLPEAIQRHLEQGLNHDLSGVRIHDDSEADKLAKGVNAIAFTTGKDIYFQSGKFNPNTQSGLELLAHEVTHTVQQGKGQVGNGIDPDAGLEAEARTMGARLAKRPLNPKDKTARMPASIAPATRVQALQREAITTPASVRTSSEPLPEEIIRYAQTHPGALASALINGTLFYSYPNSAAPMPPRYVPINQLKVVFDHLSRPALLAVKRSMLERGFGKEFFVTIAKAFSADYALALQQRIGKPDTMSEIQLTADAFIEQLTNRASYMSDTALDSTNQDINPLTGQKANTFQGKSLLAYFGYSSDLPIFGQWGFQMRIFTPIPANKIKDRAVLARRAALGLTTPIIVFRGTEGVQFNDTEGGVDTMVGDAARASVGVEQVNMNADLIKQALGRVKSGIFAGHSLGGGLAQVVAAKYPGKVTRVVTFQSPGLPANLAADFAKANHSQAHHYRVAGDIVPQAGETMLPGQINYFTRFAKDKGAQHFQTKVNMTDSHVAFPLTTLLQGQDPKTLTPEQRALIQFGAHDRGEVQKGLQARMTHTGAFDTQHDPRVNIEWARSSIAPVALGDMDYVPKMAEANIGYNILLEAVQPRLKAATTFEQFKGVYDWVNDVKQLPLSKTQEDFLERLGIRNSTPLTYPIKLSDDPKALLPAINVPLPGIMSEPTFLNDIRLHGGVVKISGQDRRRILRELHFHWASQHNGSEQALKWIEETDK